MKKETLYLKVRALEAKTRPKRALVVLFAGKDGASYKFACAPGDSADACFEAWSTGADVRIVARVASVCRGSGAALIDPESVKLAGTPRGCSVVDGTLD